MDGESAATAIVVVAVQFERVEVCGEEGWEESLRGRRISVGEGL